MAEINIITPTCLGDHPDLLFELQLASFYHHVAEGRSADAIRLSRAHLTPLTQKQPHLMPRLKACLQLLPTTAATLHCAMMASLHLLLIHFVAAAQIWQTYILLPF
jgi:hypothetical protein